MPLLVAKAFPELAKPGVLYIDAWPVMPPMLVVFHPEMMAQFTQSSSLPKHPSIIQRFMPLTQSNDLVCMSGQMWKTWRDIFNPAFSTKNLLSMLPVLLEEIDVFVDELKQVAQSGEVINLEDGTIPCTVDIMSQAILSVWFLLSNSKSILGVAVAYTLAVASAFVAKPARMSYSKR